jgi:peroxisomal membrane protein 4
MDSLNGLIASGNYKILLDAIKGFRNGVVYGVRVRAPHTLIMTLLWSRGPVPEMAMKVFRAAKQHGMNLGKFAFIYKLGVAILGRLTGPQPWHAALMGAVCGALFWGDRSPVNVQVNMYLLSRILSGFIHLYLEKQKVTPSPVAFKLYAATMWACVMYLFFHHPQVLQVSLQSSMNYIYHDSDKYSTVKDLILVNKDTAV